ncbi:protein of unknown function [Xenorhabdus doucetiae]|uniref:Uncharacterized protein n=1 Tax=Xenorhabdus doucetiae TaxID=351671 RepID=A0A068QT12_9GAMM|nr:hypothetical protein LY16_02910 [Xenorhabdus doucetiae]CDG16985.1 protein of unknown function [Xenorhabdus doucetiae]
MELSDYLNSIKWSIWHGNIDNALEYLDDCVLICDNDTLHYENHKPLLKHIDEMYWYGENRFPLHLLNRQSMKLLLSAW